MKKRILSIILCLSMMIPMLSLPAGAAVGEETNSSEVTRTGEPFEDLNQHTLAYIQNDYISFFLAVDSTNPLETGLVSHTVPTDQITDYGMSDLSVFSTRRMAFYVDCFQNEKNEDLIKKPLYLTVKKVSHSVDNKGRMIIDYTFTDERVTAKSVYTLKKLERGILDTGDETLPGGNTAQPANTENWGVSCETSVTLHTKGLISVQLIETYDNFPKTGHPNADGKASVYADEVNEFNTISSGAFQNILGVRSVKRTNITKGMGKRDTYEYGKPTVEVFTDVYPYNNPFVETGNYAVGDNLTVTSRDFPQYVSYSNSTVTTVAEGFSNLFEEGAQTAGNSAEYSSLWGFRDMVKYVERTPEPDPYAQPDSPLFFDGAGYLAVVKSGSTHKVIPCASAADVAQLAKSYTVVAQYLCNYQYISAGDFYKIEGGSIGLSSTVSANWDPSTTYFNIKSDGTLLFDGSKVSLSSLTFKFYKPKGSGLSFGGYSNDKGLTLNIDPKKNDAVVTMNFPGCICKLETASINTSGNLLFTGTFAIETLFNAASIDMDKFSYGLKNGDFKLNGIHVKGELGVHAGKPNPDEQSNQTILGLGAGKISAEIDTFSGSEKYDFALELSVRELFKAQAELKLRRLNNGRLCPNDLWVYVNVENGLGIDIPTPVPAVTLTGGGLGIKGLADTINGNYTLVPPVVLKLGVTGKVVKGIEGTMIGQIGPSILALEAQDMGISIPGTSNNIKIINKMGARLFARGKTVKYKGINYTGVNFGGGFDIGLSIFNIPQNATGVGNGVLRLFNDTLEAAAGLEVSGMIAQNDIKTSTYAGIGTVGYAKAHLNIPKNLTGLPKNIRVAGADLDFKLGFETALGANGTISDAFKNAKVTGGVVAGASVLLLNARFIYLIPKTVKFKGSFKSFDDWNWDEDPQKYQKTDSQNAFLACDPIAVELDDGREAVALALVSMSPVYLNSTRTSSTTYGYTVKCSNGVDTIPDGENLLIAVKPKYQADIQNLANTLTVSGIDLTFPTTDANGNINIDNGGSANVNAWIGTYSADTNAETGESENVQEAVFVRLSKEQVTAANGIFDISARYNIECIRGAQTIPVTSLEGVISADTLKASVKAPETNGKYRIETYYGEKDSDGNVSASYLIDSREFSDTLTEDITLPRSGNDAPSGTYYVSSYLIQTLKTDEGDDADIAVSTFVSDSTISYTNTEAPAAPANASITLMGNEGIKGTWSEVSGADGYEVIIYEQNTDGTATDTGRGYSFTADDFANISGLSYDSGKGEYSIDMGITIGDDGGDVTITDDSGAQITADGTNARHLDPEKTYKIGVKAFKTTTVEIGEEAVQGTNFSSETRSNALYLPKYEPVVITPYMYQTPLTRNDDGIYSYSGGEQLLLASCDKDSGVTFTFTNMSDHSEIPSEFFTYHGKYGFNYLDVDFDGMLMVEIKASYTHDGVTDDSYEYVLIEKDETSPMLILDSNCIIADEDGSYSITGSSEACAQIMCSDGTNAKCDENGAFTISGVLNEAENELDLDLYASDKCYNQSNSVSVTVQRGSDENITNGITVTFKPNGGSGTMDNIIIHKDGTLTLPECGFTSPAEKDFSGWKIGSKTYTEGETVQLSDNSTVTAQWKDAKVSYKWANDNRSVTGTYLKPEKVTVTVTVPLHYYDDVIGTDIDTETDIDTDSDTETEIVEKVNTTSVQAKAPTCTAKGETKYTGKFKNHIFKTQIKTAADIPAKGHNYKLTSWSWTGYSKASALFTCENDKSHTQTADAKITSERTDPTCGNDGSVVYTATVTFDGKTYTDSKTETLNKTGHNYKLTGWSWDGFEKASALFTCEDSVESAAAVFRCSNDDTHEFRESADEADITVTEKENGDLEYTATIIFDGKEYTDTKIVKADDDPTPKGLYGDIDEDGQITANDALTLLRASVGMAELLPDQHIIADVDLDENVTANDALAVLRFSVGAADEGSIVGTPIIK